MGKRGLNDAGIWRLLDANLNRVREGLRVLEDTARFVLNSASTAKALRALRHDVDENVREFYPRLLRSRDVEGDSGRQNASGTHAGASEVIVANLKRCQEAFRVLEEYGRVLSPKTVAEMQRARFELYRIEKGLLRHGKNQTV